MILQWLILSRKKKYQILCCNKHSLEDKIIEMKNIPVVPRDKEGVEMGGQYCGHKRATRVVMGMSHILTISMLTSWLCYYAIVLPLGETGWKVHKDFRIISYSYLWIYNELKIIIIIVNIKWEGRKVREDITYIKVHLNRRVECKFSLNF